MAALKKQRKRQTETWALAQSSSEDEGAAVPMLHAKLEHESVQRDNSDEQIDANFSEYGLSDGVVSPDSDCGEFKDHEEPDEGNNANLGEEIAAWAATNKCTRSALNALLLILRRQGHRLPKDARTLLQTQQRVESLEKCSGHNTCCEITSGMLKIFAKNYFQEDCLHRLLSRSPPHRYRSRSPSTHHQRQSRSRSPTPHHRHQSRSRSRTLHHQRQSRSRSRTPHHRRQSRSRTPHHRRHSNSRSWSPHHQYQSRSRTPHHQHQSNSRSRTPHKSRSRSPHSPPRSRSTSKIHNNSHVQQRSTNSIPRARIRPRGMGDVLQNEGLFQKRVIGLLQDIKKAITEVGKRTEPADSQFNLEQIETMEEVIALESRLEEAGERQTLLSQLAKIGGVGIRDNVGKVMSRLLTNKLMAGMNVKGNGGKYAFGGTNLYKVVIGSIQHCQPGATETAISKRLAECLKGAPDRKGGGGRKAAVLKTEVD